MEKMANKKKRRKTSSEGKIKVCAYPITKRGGGAHLRSADSSNPPRGGRDQ